MDIISYAHMYIHISHAYQGFSGEIGQDLQNWLKLPLESSTQTEKGPSRCSQMGPHDESGSP